MRSQLIKKRSEKAGLPPGSLVHIGEHKTTPVKLTVFNFDEKDYREQEIEADSCANLKSSPGITWLNVDGVHQPEIVQKIGAAFNLHPLVLEDILNTNQRPKLEDYGDYLYVVLKMLFFNGQKKEIITEQVSFILGEKIVISFQEGKEGDTFQPLRHRIQSGKGQIRKMGAGYLLYSLMDTIIDNYFSVIEIIGEKIETLEDQLIDKPSPTVLQGVHHLKRKLIFLRKAVWPLREVIGALEHGESPLIGKDCLIYMRDIYDHTIQSMDSLETYREMLTEMLDIYLSRVGNRMNEIMKVLTIIGTIFLPLTFIVGIYGMNFKYMPELEWWWAYPAVMTGMGILVLFMLGYFKKKKWF